MKRIDQCWVSQLYLLVLLNGGSVIVSEDVTHSHTFDHTHQVDEDVILLDRFNVDNSVDSKHEGG